MLELQYELSLGHQSGATIEISSVFFSIPSAAESSPLLVFTWTSIPVHLEPTAPEVETQSHHLPWTDPSCTGQG